MSDKPVILKSESYVENPSLRRMPALIQSSPNPSDDEEEFDKYDHIVYSSEDEEEALARVAEEERKLKEEALARVAQEESKLNGNAKKKAARSASAQW